MFTISQIHHPDIPAAAEFITALRTDMNGYAVCTPQQVEEVLERSLEETSYRGFIARDEAGNALGYIGINKRFAIYAGGHFAQVTELFVDPGVRRSGVAARLLAAAERHAREHGATSMELGAPAPETHPGTHAFYEDQGYHIAGPRLSKGLY